MVDVNTIFIREAKQTRDTHQYICETSLPALHYSTPLLYSITLPSVKQNYHRQQVIICSRDYAVTIGGCYPQKLVRTYGKLKASRFSKISSNFKKVKGLKSLF